MLSAASSFWRQRRCRLLREPHGGASASPLELLAGADGLDRLITSPHVQKTGLALAGFHEYLKPGPRADLRRERNPVPREPRRRRARRRRCGWRSTHDFPCVLITGGFDAAAGADRRSRARAACRCCKTSVPTPTAIAKLDARSSKTRLAERTMIHGVLLDILGLGVLITGESGIGKSECALDLIVRGHRLVADDTVEMRRRSETILIGTCPELTRHHMELRGLGVINVKDLFGIASTRSSKRVELVVQLERWDPTREYERLGLDDEFYEILGLPGAADPDAGRARAATSRSSSRSRRAISCCERAATTRRACSPSGSTRRCGRRRRPRQRPGRRRRRGRRDRGRRPAVKRPSDEAARRAGRAPKPPARPAVHRPDRPVRLGKVAGDPRARGPRLLLRRQPADDADSDAGQAVDPRRRHREGRDRRRRPRSGTSCRRSRRSSAGCGRCAA